MDLLSQHEAFLRAIFDNPEDDTARLVYADFLDENDLPIRAELLRVQCELARMDDDCDPSHWAMLEERNHCLSSAVVPWNEMRTGSGITMNRGLWRESFADGVAVTAEDLDDPRKFREWVVRVNPAWYGETKMYVRFRSELLSKHIHTLSGLPFVHQVTECNLSGHREEVPRDEVNQLREHFDFFPEPPGPWIRGWRAINTGALNEFLRNRWARRIVSLDLRNNSLDNDVVCALVKSPYLDNLKRLQILEGNQLRGKVWQQVLERFGEDVVE
ncbi:MAG: hypothetical protein C0467_29735 [Planctomycetaceae bacterium]|nr:hypothetical protein [Planctomycetaceae bacterium]